MSLSIHYDQRSRIREERNISSYLLRKSFFQHTHRSSLAGTYDILQLSSSNRYASRCCLAFGRSLASSRSCSSYTPAVFLAPSRAGFVTVGFSMYGGWVGARMPPRRPTLMTASAEVTVQIGEAMSKQGEVRVGRAKRKRWNRKEKGGRAGSRKSKEDEQGSIVAVGRRQSRPRL